MPLLWVMRLTLTLLEAEFAVCRFAPSEPLPVWAFAGELFTVSRSREELSVVCEQALVPDGVGGVGPWRAFKLEGPFDFALTGVLLSVLEPLARAGVGIFAVSTFDTDYVLVRSEHLHGAERVLSEAGHTLNRVQDSR